MEKDTNKKADDFMENIRRKTLENETNLLFHKTNKGRFVELVVILSGIGGVFLYHHWGVNIIFSLILGFITYLVIGVIFDKIVGKFFRIDKQLDWLQNNPEGQKLAEEKGASKEQLDEIKKELGL